MGFKNFLKQNFFDGYVPLKPVMYCIVIVYEDGHSYERYGIEQPYAYIKEVLKNPRVKTAYIKS
jgi:hypothetical protein